MKYHRKQNIQQYQELLHQLDQFGIYQIKIIAVMAICSCFSGLMEGLFQLQIAWNESATIFYSQEIIKILILIVISSLSIYFSRKFLNIVSLSIMIFGGILFSIGIIIQINFQNQTIKNIGLYILVCFHYTISFSMLMVCLEFFHIKRYSLMLMINLLTFTFGSVIAVQVNDNLSNKQSVLFVILPALLIYIATFFFYSESPRFLIDQNLNQAEKLLKNIMTINKIKQQKCLLILQRQFFWNRISLRKFSLLDLHNFKSVSFNTYVLGISCLMLGIIIRCPDFIQDAVFIQQFQIKDSVQIMWMSFFQFCGLIPAYLFSKSVKRRTVSIILSSILCIISCLLILIPINISQGDPLLESMVIFGINSFFSKALMYEIFLSSIQFYPHTIRTLACGFLQASFRFGKVLFSIHIREINKPTSMIQLVICSSVILILHCCLISQTASLKGQYQIAQIEQKQSQGYQ